MEINFQETAKEKLLEAGFKEDEIFHDGDFVLWWMRTPFGTIFDDAKKTLVEGILRRSLFTVVQ